MAHARLSPSAAERWMSCPGAPNAEAPYPRVSTIYAAEGTAAHELASWCLQENTFAAAYIGRKIEADGFKFDVDAAMAGHVQTYVDFVRDVVAADGATLLVEQRVPLDHVTGEVGAHGTSDVVALRPDIRELRIADLKYGQGKRVEVRNNSQLKVYALAALEKFDPMCELFDIVRVYIHQPRISNVGEWVVTVVDLMEWAKTLRRAADATHDPKAPRVPGAHCGFCEHRKNCAERRSGVATLVYHRPDALDIADKVPTVKPDDLAAAWRKLDEVEAWAKDVRAEVYARLKRGEPVGDLKLVAGKKGNRAWTDSEKAAATMMTALEGDIYTPRVVISPSVAQDRLKQLHPAVWDALQQFITQSDGAPVVAAGDSPKPAISLSIADKFEAFGD